MLNITSPVHYDLVLPTDTINPDEVLAIILAEYGNWLKRDSQ
jgi:cytidylate kinase